MALLRRGGQLVSPVRRKHQQHQQGTVVWGRANMVCGFENGRLLVLRHVDDLFEEAC